MSTIGTVNEYEEAQKLKFSIKWKIDNYSELHLAENIAYCSPPFVFSGATWTLKFCPYGESENDSVGYVNIYLVKLHSRKEKDRINCSIFIQNSDKNFYFSFKIYDEFEWDGSECGKVKFMKTEAFMAFGISEIICRFHMKVFFDLEQQESIIKKVPKSFPSNKENIMNALSQNMKNLFFNQKDCDVILNVSGQEFPAHKSILSARCVVFFHMFDCEMTENLSGRVNIQDVDPNVFKNVLLYIYSGEIEGLSSDNVYEYYNLADKFQLEELREACLEFMERNVSISNAYYLSMLANDLGHTRLNDIVEKFIVDNFLEYMMNYFERIHGHPNSPKLPIVDLNPRDGSS